jgi:hypothetical protein
MTDITEYDKTDFDFVDRENGDRRKNRDRSVGKEFFTLRFGDTEFAGKNRRKSEIVDRRNVREVVDTTGTTLWTNDDTEFDFTEFDITVPRGRR